MHHTINKTQCSYTLATKTTDDFNVTKCSYFDPKSDGFEVWEQLKNTGKFEKDDDCSQVHGEMGCGIACQTVLRKGETKEIPITLVWDMPLICFPKKQKKYYRFYTQHFGKENAALKIMAYALEEYKNWERAIYRWQKPVLSDRLNYTYFHRRMFVGNFFTVTYQIGTKGPCSMKLTM